MVQDHDFVSFLSDPEQLQLTLVACPDGVIATGIDGRVILYTGASEEIFGFAPIDLLGQPVAGIFATARDYARFDRRLRKDRHVVNLEIRAVHRDRTPFPASISAALLRDRYGEDTGAIMYVRDHTQLRRIEEQLRDRNRRLNDLVEQLDHVARHDQLTGMLRRNSAVAAAESAMLALGPGGVDFGVALFDIDHFKSVNDTYGHDAGDRALSALASVISHQGRHHDLIGRYGGEEFVAFLPGANLAAVTAFAERVRTAISGFPVPVGDGGITTVTISAGVASVPHCAPTLADAMHLADTRLLMAKRSGRNRVQGGIQDDRSVA